MVEQVESEANEPTFVGDENSLNLTTLDALNQREETRRRLPESTRPQQLRQPGSIPPSPPPEIASRRAAQRY
jgi:hypothetical protein